MKKKLADLKVQSFVTATKNRSQEQAVGASTNRLCPTVYCGSCARYCSFDGFTCGAGTLCG